MHIARIRRWPRSSVGAYMHGQPPSITVIPKARPVLTAAGSTLLPPKARCSQTCVIPSAMHSFIASCARSARVPITTASTPPGMSDRLA